MQIKIRKLEEYIADVDVNELPDILDSLGIDYFGVKLTSIMIADNKLGYLAPREENNFQDVEFKPITDSKVHMTLYHSLISARNAIIEINNAVRQQAQI